MRVIKHSYDKLWVEEITIDGSICLNSLVTELNHIKNTMVNLRSCTAFEVEFSKYCIRVIGYGSKEVKTK